MKEIFQDTFKLFRIVFTLYLTISWLLDLYNDSSWILSYMTINWQLLGVEALLLFLLLVPVVTLYVKFPRIMSFGLFSLFGVKSGNVNISGSTWKYFGILYCLLLMTALPSITLWEEQQFRQGTTNWFDGVWRSLLFALVHTLVGVPVLGVIVIFFVGMFLTYLYFKGGIWLAAQAHFQYDLILVSLLLVFAIINSFFNLQKNDAEDQNS